MRLTVRRAAARRVFSEASTSSLRPSRDGIMWDFPASSTVKSTSRGARATPRLRLSKYSLASGTADTELPLPVVRQFEERRDLLGRDGEAEVLVGEDHGARESGANLLGDGGERIPSHCRRGGLDGEGDRPLALEGGERRHHRGRRRVSLQRTARLARDDDRLVVAEHDCGLASVDLDLLRDHAQLSVQSSLVDRGRGLDFGAEQAELETFQPTKGDRAVTAVQRFGRRAAPVSADGELRRCDRPAAAGSREDHRLG